MVSSFNPLVSIIIPVFNGAKYLREAIDSALAQTYDNVEIIVVNDGSTDNTEEIALSYKNKIKYFTQKNGGVSSALNKAILKAEGEYISWLSHDDLYYPNKIERQLDAISRIQTYDQKKTIVFSNYDILNTYTNIREEGPILFNFSPEDPIYTHQMLDIFFSSKIGGCTLLIPKNLFNEIGYFDTNHRTTQDYWLFIKLFKSGIKFRYISEILVTSRHHKDQDTHRLLPIHIQELNFLYKNTFDFFKEVFQKMPLWQFEHFLNIIKQRSLDKVYAYMISEWANGEWNKDQPVIWMYWENKLGSATPDAIRLCWKTIINHNKYDFKIKILTEDDIETYLPKIDQEYKRYKEIAHKADYIRFNLLYEYGGIWLDSDTIVFRSLNEIKDKINNFGFVCNGYLDNGGKIFPIISFLASKPKNLICERVLNRIELIIKDKIVNGINQEWDEVGKILYDIINELSARVYIYPIEYFYPFKVYSDDNLHFERIEADAHDFFLNSNVYSFGQALANSGRTIKFKFSSENELLNQKGLIGSMFKIGYNINSKDALQISQVKLLNNDDSKIDYLIEKIEKIIELKIMRQLILKIVFPVGKLINKVARKTKSLFFK